MEYFVLAVVLLVPSLPEELENKALLLVLAYEKLEEEGMLLFDLFAELDYLVVDMSYSSYFVDVLVVGE